MNKLETKKEESKVFLVKKIDQKIETRGGRFEKLRVFTEQGVAMLATILHTNVATKINIKMMRMLKIQYLKM